MTERLFFALWPDAAVRRGLLKICGDLPRYHGREPHPEDLHLTLAFLGEIDAERRRCAEEAADRVQAEPFRLRLDRVGHWARPRILWCGASDCPTSLLGLLAGLNQGLLGCGFTPERRPFVPHLTLARKAPRLEAFELDPPLDWLVAEFVLVGSRLGERPSYQVLRGWPLALHDASKLGV
ncbi:MAG: RNA 2',3'-cyclic phosphodiesterase [Chromatiaceae bacterium]|nr:RNA 2',3'-cyclic phosphodiesterase [Chromatiaceae bacterium]